MSDSPEAEIMQYAPVDQGRFAGAREILRIALPSSLSMISFTAMQFIDGFMVAKIRPLGAESLSAQYVGGFASFVPLSFFFGMLAMVSTLVSQNLGAKRLNQCGRYAWAGIFTALVSSAILLLLIPLAGFIFDALGHEQQVRSMEVMYFRFMIFFAPMNFVSCCFENFFFGLHRAMVVFVVSVLANVLNAIGNYMLIFGKCGLPAMGLKGAAIATGIGCAVKLLCFAFIFFSGQSRDKYASWDFRSVTKKHIFDLLKIGAPAGLQFFLDIFAWGLSMTVLIGWIDTVLGELRPDASTIHLAATTVVMRYIHVSFMPCVGISVAIAAVVGRHIGSGRKDLARKRTWTAWMMGMCYMGLCGACFAIFGEQLAEFFMAAGLSQDKSLLESRELVIEIAKRVFYCAAVFQIFDATGIVLGGALKGAGDTVFTIIVAAVGGVLVNCGGGVLMLWLFPQLESVGIWIAGAVSLIFMGIAYVWRFASGRWERIDLLGDNVAITEPVSSILLDSE